MVSAGTAAWRRATARIEQDVAESGCAVVDRGDAERGGGRVGHPDGHAVADPQVAGVREHAADGDGVVVDVTQRAVDHDRVERARRRRAAQARGRPRGLVAETCGEWIDLGRHQRCDRVDAVEPSDRGGGAGGQGRSVGADDDVRRPYAQGRDVLGVTLVAGLDDALGAGEHRDEHDRRRQRRRAPAVRRQSGAGQQSRKRRSGVAGAASTAAGIPSSQRPSSPVPMARRIPPRTANTIAQ